MRNEEGYLLILRNINYLKNRDYSVNKHYNY